MWPQFWCLWTYFGVLWTYFGVRWSTFGVLWSAFGCLWMTLDDLGVSPTNGRCALDMPNRVKYLDNIR
jgi:hypothetical protein